MLDFFKKIFKRGDPAEEILKDLEESQRRYEKLRKRYQKELEKWKSLPENEKEKMKSVIDLRYKFSEDDLRSFRVRVLHFLLTLILGFAVINLYFMYYYVRYGVLTEGMVLVEVSFSLLFILTFLYYLVKEKRLVDEVYKYFVLSEEIRRLLKNKGYREESI